MLDILDVWRDMTGRAPVTRRPPLARSDILSRKADPRSQRICSLLCCCATALPRAACSSCELLELSLEQLLCRFTAPARRRTAGQNTRGCASLVVDGLSCATTGRCSRRRRPPSTRIEEKCRLRGLEYTHTSFTNAAKKSSRTPPLRAQHSNRVATAVLLLCCEHRFQRFGCARA